MVWSAIAGIAGAALGYLGQRRSQNIAQGQYQQQRQDWLNPYDLSLGRPELGENPSEGDQRNLANWTRWTNQQASDQWSAELSNKYWKSQTEQLHQNANRRFDYGVNRLRGMGLTPQELAGSPMPGGAGGGSGAETTLGNQNIQAQQHQNQMQLQALSNQGQARVASINAQAQLGAQALKVGMDERKAARSDTTQRRGQDVQSRGQDLIYETAARDRVLRTVLQGNELDVRQMIAAENRKLSREQLTEKRREVDLAAEKWNTTKYQQEKSWLLKMKLMTMSAENVMTYFATEFLNQSGRAKDGNITLDDINFLARQSNKKDVYGGKFENFMQFIRGYFRMEHDIEAKDGYRGQRDLKQSQSPRKWWNR